MVDIGNRTPDDWSDDINKANPGFDYVNPNTAGTINADDIEPVKRRRGRQPLPRDAEGNIIRDGIGGATGTTARKAQKTSAPVLDPSSLTPIIMTVHMILGAKIPEFTITEPEAKQLSVAICQYLRHTNIRMTQKTQDFAALIMAIAMIEGTRLMAFVNNRKIKEAAQRYPKPFGEGNVTPFVPGSIPGL